MGIFESPETLVMEEVKSLEDFDKLLARKKPKPSITSYLVVSLILPPITLIPALVMASRKNLFEPALAIITAAYSITYFLLVIQVSALNRALSSVPDLNISTTPLSPFLTDSMIALCAIGLVLGVFFRFKYYRDGALTKYTKAILIGIIILQTIFSFLILGRSF